MKLGRAKSVRAAVAVEGLVEAVVAAAAELVEGVAVVAVGSGAVAAGIVAIAVDAIGIDRLPTRCTIKL
jgi:hypothetical protein